MASIVLGAEQIAQNRPVPYSGQAYILGEVTINEKINRH